LTVDPPQPMHAYLVALAASDVGAAGLSIEEACAIIGLCVSVAFTVVRAFWLWRRDRREARPRRRRRPG